MEINKKKLNEKNFTTCIKICKNVQKNEFRNMNKL